MILAATIKTARVDYVCKQYAGVVYVVGAIVVWVVDGVHIKRSNAVVTYIRAGSAICSGGPNQQIGQQFAF
jgi:hypothetical protein